MTEDELKRLEKEFKRWFDEWRAGNKEGAYAFLKHLDKTCRSSIKRSLWASGCTCDFIYDYIDDGLWQMIEELDLMVSGGETLFEYVMDPLTGKRRRRGILTGRTKLGPRSPFTWMGITSFQKFAKVCWFLRGKSLFLRDQRRTGKSQDGLGINAPNDSDDDILPEENIPYDELPQTLRIDGEKEIDRQYTAVLTLMNTHKDSESKMRILIPLREYLWNKVKEACPHLSSNRIDQMKMKQLVLEIRDITTIELDPTEARQFMWVEHILPYLKQNCSSVLENETVAKNTFLEAPICRLRSELQLAVPWFFNKERR